MSDTPKIGLECNKCGDRIFSLYRHDFVSCGCGAIFVDGGDAYLRIGGEEEDFTQITMNEQDIAKITANVQRATIEIELPVLRPFGHSIVEASLLETNSDGTYKSVHIRTLATKLGWKNPRVYSMLKTIANRRGMCLYKLKVGTYQLKEIVGAGDRPDEK